MDFQFPVKPPAFNIMAKPIGPVCNLDCQYCYYLEKEKLYDSSKRRKLEGVTLEKFIREYIESQDVPVVSFVWQGGEPALLGVDYFREVVDIQNRYAGDKKIENNFQTNGTLLTDDFCRFFKEHNFLVGISIDGPRDLHDNYRTDKNKKPVWHKVMAGIEKLKAHQVEFNTLTAVNDKNVEHPLSVYRFLKQIGSRFMQFLPVVERQALNKTEPGLSLVHQQYDGQAAVTNWSVKPKAFGNFLTSIFDEWVRNDVGKYYVQLFDVTLANWAGATPGLCVFSDSCGTAAVMEHNGDVYCCDHYVYDDHFLGNIHEMPLQSIMALPRQAIFGQEKKAGLTAHCKSCSFRFACHGDCPKHRFAISLGGEPGHSYLCEAYKTFFAHAKPYMDFMLKELKAKRPPANVMQWIRNKELASQPRPAKTGRNAPCPCGSGKKFKHCHGSGSNIQ
jgi:uncharacterized protein